MAQASAEKFEHPGPVEQERIASAPRREQLARTTEPSLPRGKEQSHPFKSRDREEREIESRLARAHFSEKEGGQSERME